MRGMFLSLWLLAFSALWIGQAAAHGGGLDAYSGHHNRKQGAYHFHRGPLAGLTFPGKAEALDALKRYMEEAALSRRQEQPPQAQSLESADNAEQALAGPQGDQ